jgi:AcrR family transcriptional regulator
MPAKSAPPRKKARGSYHHGDLEQALVDAALETIRTAGVAGLTLRGVGARVGVSRTALYRHFRDKEALLARVALEGFRLFHAALAAGRARAARENGDALTALGLAYVGFAAAHPTYYDAMFGGYLTDWDRYPELDEEARAAFTELVDMVGSEQERGRFAAGHPVEIAEIIWSLSHGMVMLSAAGQLCRTDAGTEDLIVASARILRDGLRPAPRQPVASARKRS